MELLVASAKYLNGYIENRNYSSRVWSTLHNDLVEALEGDSNWKELEMCIGMDVFFYLPVDVRVTMYEKLLSFNRSRDALGEFSNYLSMYDEYDSYRLSILEEISKMDI